MLAAVILLAPLADPSLSYAQAKALADTNENGLPAAAHAALLDVQNRVLRAAVTACKRPAPDFSSFTVVLKLNADGSVAQSWLKGHTALARCVRTHLVYGGVPGHWTAPFYTSFEVSFHGE